jgi:hypothetical protein
MLPMMDDGRFMAFIVAAALVFIIICFAGCKEDPNFMENNPQWFASVIPITSDMGPAERELVTQLNLNRRYGIARDSIMDKYIMLEAAKRSQPIVVQKAER